MDTYGYYKDEDEVPQVMKELNLLADFVKAEGEVTKGEVMVKFGWQHSKASSMISAALDVFEFIRRRGRKIVYIPQEKSNAKNPFEL